MKYFPAFLDLQERLCLVVGGGGVAERKVRSLVQAGAKVKVISPAVTPFLVRMARGGKIDYRSRTFRAGDLKGAFLVIAATDDRDVNERVSAQALRRNLAVNVVDDPAHSSFIVPAVVAQGDLVVAISTSGNSPALARALRQRFAREIGPEYAFLLKLMGALRRRVLALGWDQKRNRRVFRRLVREDLPALIRQKDREGLESRLSSVLGPGFSLAELRLKL